jgi:transposase
MKKRVITLTDDKRQELENIRNTSPKPYVRQRAAAILKIANGDAAYNVAKQGLLKPVAPDTVYRWLNSYIEKGIKGLYRKTYHRSTISAQEGEALEYMIHRAPYLFGQSGSRWTLAKIRATFPRLSGYTHSGIWRLLKRLRIVYKRGRLHITSPDLHYNEKKEWIEEAKSKAREQSDEVVTLFGDEKTYRRVPELSSAYGCQGTDQPKVMSAPGKNTQRRIGGVMNMVDGSIWYIQRHRIGVDALVDEIHEVSAWVRQRYPQVKEINLIWDCWPTHYHPDVLLAAYRAGIMLIPLPTYAPWENPIEKLWRWLCQEVLYMHRFSGAWKALWKMVDDFLAQFINGSQALLRYVGLLPQN